MYKQRQGKVLTHYHHHRCRRHHHHHNHILHLCSHILFLRCYIDVAMALKQTFNSLSLSSSSSSPSSATKSSSSSSSSSSTSSSVSVLSTSNARLSTVCFARRGILINSLFSHYNTYIVYLERHCINLKPHRQESHISK